MSTFHKSTLLKFKNDNYSAVKSMSETDLNQLLKIINELSLPAIKLEEFALSHVPGLRLFSSDTDKLFFTTLIIALKGVVENEITVREIQHNTLFDEVL